MKKSIKFLLITLVLCLFAFVLLYKQIAGVYALTNTKKLVSKNPATEIIPSNPITLGNNLERIESTYEFRNLKIPALYTKYEEKSSDTILVLQNPNKENQIFTVSEGIRFADEFLEDSPSKEALETCSFLSSRTRKNICSENYFFLSEILSTHSSEISLLSPTQEKFSVSIILILKTAFLYNETKSIQPLETKDLRGYLSTADRIKIAYLFDSDDNPYNITFYNVPDSDVMKILENISVTK